MKKRVFACLLVAALLALIGCGTKKEADPQAADESTVSAEVVNPSEAENVSGAQNGQENIQMERTRAIWEKRATTDYMIDPSESMIVENSFGVRSGFTPALGNLFFEYMSGVFDADIAFVCARNNDPSMDIEELAQIAYSENGFDEDCLMLYIDLDTNHWTILKKGNMTEMPGDRLTEIAERGVVNFTENGQGYGLFEYIRELYAYLCEEKNIIAEGVGEGVSTYGIFEIQPGSERVVGVDEKNPITTGTYSLYCDSHGRIKVTDSAGSTIYYKYIPRTLTRHMSNRGLGGGTAYLPKEIASDGEESSDSNEIGQARVVGDWNDSAVEELYPTENMKEYVYYSPFFIRVKNGDVIEFEGNAPLELVGIGHYLNDEYPFHREVPNIKINKWLEAHGCDLVLPSYYDDEVDWRSLP